jgi:Tol biopolymer transport system component
MHDKNAKIANMQVQSAYELKDVSIFNKNAGRVDWLHNDKELIAFDRKGEDGYYDIYITDKSASFERCLTCKNLDLPQKHQGQPAFYPSGEWIVFQAEKKSHKGSSTTANPGIGVFNDLWVISQDGTKVKKLVSVQEGDNYGTLHPHFSSDGKKLVWGEMYQKANIFAKNEEFGLWKIKIADVSITNGFPAISNIQEFQPLGPSWYETHGFSPDGETLYFTSNARRPAFSTNIYSYQYQAGKTNLLAEGGYNEHAQISPDGAKIIWIHTDGIFTAQKGTDFWIMNSNGTNKKQLTYFRQEGHLQYDKDLVIAADGSWNRNGTQYLGFVQNGLRGQKEQLVLLTF